MPRFDWSADVLTVREPKAPKTPKTKRGHNPPGARTKNEPPRVFFREETEPLYNYRKPKATPQEDTPMLRIKVSLTAQRLVQALRHMDIARDEFEALGPLPTKIIDKLPMRIKRQLHLYKMRGT